MKNNKDIIRNMAELSNILPEWDVENISAEVAVDILHKALRKVLFGSHLRDISKDIESKIIVLKEENDNYQSDYINGEVAALEFLQKLIEWEIDEVRSWLE